MFRKNAKVLLGSRSEVELSTLAAESDDIKAWEAGEDILSEVMKNGPPMQQKPLLPWLLTILGDSPFPQIPEKPWIAWSPLQAIISLLPILKPASAENSENFYGSFEIHLSLPVTRVYFFQQIIYIVKLVKIPTFQLLLPREMRLGKETRLVSPPISTPRLRIYLFP